MKGELPADSTAAFTSNRSKCQAFEVQISKLIDRELSASSITELKQHLDTCEGCRVKLTRWKEQSTVLGQALESLWNSKSSGRWRAVSQTSQ